MMISPEGYYEEYLKGKNEKQLMTAIRGLKQEIGRLKIRWKLSFQMGISRSRLAAATPALIISMHCRNCLESVKKMKAKEI